MLKAKDLMNNARDSFAAGFAEAIKNGDDKALADVIATFSEDVQQALMEEHNDLVSSTNDAAVLAARGTRVLTSAETKYYNALIEAMKSDKPQAAITGIKETLPETIIDAVLDDIEAQFPLLDAIDFRNTTGITKWPYNKKGLQYAVWGPLGSKIIEELSGDIGALSIEQCKLTAFMAVSKDFLKLGPAWIDRYVRAILAEANGAALELAVVDGDGSKGPIGMNRDLTKGTTSDGSTKYTAKTATKVTDLEPASYGAILADIAKTPEGRQRVLRDVIMVVSPQDYLTKVMPATTARTPDGRYVNDILPYPTRIIQSVGVPTGKAIVGLAKRYFMGVGTPKEGLIEYSDHAQFIDDNRVYTTHFYGNGRPLDNNAFKYLDISALEPLVMKVKDVTPAVGG
ncbi:MAG: phage major capsid protein [Candidatus Alectryocaccobium sp.]|jgi:hypothetical protein